VLEQGLAQPFEDIVARLANGGREEQTRAEENSEIPSIVCTTLVGAKGLSAGHVFIVGFNDGHFPQHPEAITDEDICKFIVGLSRTRKQCHLVSCGRFGAERLSPSSFLDWVRPLVEHRKIDKRTWE
jgi:superfamily I DNA/RNA helicase